ncbi:unnamed protein product [Vitrella brassicaformis CCMP3155]|uniref:Uncharacterized protein n=7 Tax=Vitrella brassicaformis TaxID=1169539 RepID=A0A0G4GR93_VITBC|nr:unnamed protein product [Vitrella brassicaformis CCMP3155]|eukprot:CEM33052.1 unnamed protein product [Vitrella brassicaformis CCMP3155]
MDRPQRGRRHRVYRPHHRQQENGSGEQPTPSADDHHHEATSSGAAGRGRPIVILPTYDSAPSRRGGPSQSSDALQQPPPGGRGGPPDGRGGHPARRRNEKRPPRGQSDSPLDDPNVLLQQTPLQTFEKVRWLHRLLTTTPAQQLVEGLQYQQHDIATQLFNSLQAALLKLKGQAASSRQMQTGYQDGLKCFEIFVTTLQKSYEFWQWWANALDCAQEPLDVIVVSDIGRTLLAADPLIRGPPQQAPPDLARHTSQVGRERQACRKKVSEQLMQYLTDGDYFMSHTDPMLNFSEDAGGNPIFPLLDAFASAAPDEFTAHFTEIVDTACGWAMHLAKKNLPHPTKVVFEYFGRWQRFFETGETTRQWCAAQRKRTLVAMQKAMQDVARSPSETGVRIVLVHLELHLAFSAALKASTPIDQLIDDHRRVLTDLRTLPAIQRAHGGKSAEPVDETEEAPSSSQAEPPGHRRGKASWKPVIKDHHVDLIKTADKLLRATVALLGPEVGCVYSECIAYLQACHAQLPEGQRNKVVPLVELHLELLKAAGPSLDAQTALTYVTDPDFMQLLNSPGPGRLADALRETYQVCIGRDEPQLRVPLVQYFVSQLAALLSLLPAIPPPLIDRAQLHVKSLAAPPQTPAAAAATEDQVAALPELSKSLRAMSRLLVRYLEILDARPPWPLLFLLVLVPNSTDVPDAEGGGGSEMSQVGLARYLGRFWRGLGDAIRHSGWTACNTVLCDLVTLYGDSPATAMVWSALGESVLELLDPSTEAAVREDILAAIETHPAVLWLTTKDPHIKHKILQRLAASISAASDGSDAPDAMWLRCAVAMAPNARGMDVLGGDVKSDSSAEIQRALYEGAVLYVATFRSLINKVSSPDVRFNSLLHGGLFAAVCSLEMLLLNPSPLDDSVRGTDARTALAHIRLYQHRHPASANGVAALVRASYVPLWSTEMLSDPLALPRMLPGGWGGDESGEAEVGGGAAVGCRGEGVMCLPALILVLIKAGKASSHEMLTILNNIRSLGPLDPEAFAFCHPFVSPYRPSLSPSAGADGPRSPTSVHETVPFLPPPASLPHAHQLTWTLLVLAYTMVAQRFELPFIGTAATAAAGGGGGSGEGQQQSHTHEREPGGRHGRGGTPKERGRPPASSSAAAAAAGTQSGAKAGDSPVSHLPQFLLYMHTLMKESAANSCTASRLWLQGMRGDTADASIGEGPSRAALDDGPDGWKKLVEAPFPLPLESSCWQDILAQFTSRGGDSSTSSSGGCVGLVHPGSVVLFLHLLEQMCVLASDGVSVHAPSHVQGTLLSVPSITFAESNRKIFTDWFQKGVRRYFSRLTLGRFLSSPGYFSVCETRLVDVIAALRDRPSAPAQPPLIPPKSPEVRDDDQLQGSRASRAGTQASPPSGSLRPRAGVPLSFSSTHTTGQPHPPTTGDLTAPTLQGPSSLTAASQTTAQPSQGEGRDVGGHRPLAEPASAAAAAAGQHNSVAHRPAEGAGAASKRLEELEATILSALLSALSLNNSGTIRGLCYLYKARCSIVLQQLVREEQSHQQHHHLWTTPSADSFLDGDQSPQAQARTPAAILLSKVYRGDTLLLKAQPAFISLAGGRLEEVCQLIYGLRAHLAPSAKSTGPCVMVIRPTGDAPEASAASSDLPIALSPANATLVQVVLARAWRDAACALGDKTALSRWVETYEQPGAEMVVSKAALEGVRAQLRLLDGERAGCRSSIQMALAQLPADWATADQQRDVEESLRSSSPRADESGSGSSSSPPMPSPSSYHYEMVLRLSEWPQVSDLFLMDAAATAHDLIDNPPPHPPAPASPLLERFYYSLDKARASIVTHMSAQSVVEPMPAFPCVSLGSCGAMARQATALRCLDLLERRVTERIVDGGKTGEVVLPSIDDMKFSRSLGLPLHFAATDLMRLHNMAVRSGNQSYAFSLLHPSLLPAPMDDSDPIYAAQHSLCYAHSMAATGRLPYAFTSLQEALTALLPHLSKADHDGGQLVGQLTAQLVTEYVDMLRAHHRVIIDSESTREGDASPLDALRVSGGLLEEKVGQLQTQLLQIRATRRIHTDSTGIPVDADVVRAIGQHWTKKDWDPSASPPGAAKHPPPVHHVTSHLSAAHRPLFNPKVAGWLLRTGCEIVRDSADLWRRYGDWCYDQRRQVDGPQLAWNVLELLKQQGLIKSPTTEDGSTPLRERLAQLVGVCRTAVKEWSELHPPAPPTAAEMEKGRSLAQLERQGAEAAFDWSHALSSSAMCELFPPRVKTAVVELLKRYCRSLHKWRTLTATECLAAYARYMSVGPPKATGGGEGAQEARGWGAEQQSECILPPPHATLVKMLLRCLKILPAQFNPKLALETITAPAIPPAVWLQVAPQLLATTRHPHPLSRQAALRLFWRLSDACPRHTLFAASVSEQSIAAERDDAAKDGGHDASVRLSEGGRAMECLREHQPDMVQALSGLLEGVAALANPIDEVSHRYLERIVAFINSDMSLQPGILPLLYGKVNEFHAALVSLSGDTVLPQPGSTPTPPRQQRLPPHRGGRRGRQQQVDFPPVQPIAPAPQASAPSPSAKGVQKAVDAIKMLSGGGAPVVDSIAARRFLSRIVPQLRYALDAHASLGEDDERQRATESGGGGGAGERRDEGRWGEEAGKDPGNMRRSFITHLTAILKECGRIPSQPLREISPSLEQLSSSVATDTPLKQPLLHLPTTTPSGAPALLPLCRFGPKVSCLATKTRPKKVVIEDDKGQQHTFLLKGRDDLQLDQRLMQVLALTTRVLEEEGRAGWRCRHYDVVPLSPRSGLIRWVNNAVPFFALLKQRKIQKEQLRLLQAQLKASAPVAPQQGGIISLTNLTGSQRKETDFHHKFQPYRKHFEEGGGGVGGGPTDETAVRLVSRIAAAVAGRIEGATEAYHRKVQEKLERRGMNPNTTQRKDWPADMMKEVFLELQSETPPDIISRELFLSSTHPAHHTALTASFATSTAIHSAIGHLIGLGDRHLDNILLDARTGEVVHVDVSICFDRGARLRVPECVPFRLTRIISYALGPTGTHGIFQETLEDVLCILGEWREMYAGLMDTLLLAPLHDWLSAAALPPPVSLEEVAVTRERVLKEALSSLLDTISRDTSKQLSRLAAEAQEVARAQSSVIETLRELSLTGDSSGYVTKKDRIDYENKTNKIQKELSDLEAKHASSTAQLVECRATIQSSAVALQGVYQFLLSLQHHYQFSSHFLVSFKSPVALIPPVKMPTDVEQRASVSDRWRAIHRFSSRAQKLCNIFINLQCTLRGLSERVAPLGMLTQAWSNHHPLQFFMRLFAELKAPTHSPDEPFQLTTDTAVLNTAVQRLDEELQTMRHAAQQQENNFVAVADQLDRAMQLFAKDGALSGLRVRLERRASCMRRDASDSLASLKPKAVGVGMGGIGGSQSATARKKQLPVIGGCWKWCVHLLKATKTMIEGEGGLNTLVELVAIMDDVLEVLKNCSSGGVPADLVELLKGWQTIVKALYAFEASALSLAPSRLQVLHPSDLHETHTDTHRTPPDPPPTGPLLESPADLEKADAEVRFGVLFDVDDWALTNHPVRNVGAATALGDGGPQAGVVPPWLQRLGEVTAEGDRAANEWKRLSAALSREEVSFTGMAEGTERVKKGLRGLSGHLDHLLSINTDAATSPSESSRDSVAPPTDFAPLDGHIKELQSAIHTISNELTRLRDDITAAQRKHDVDLGPSSPSSASPPTTASSQSSNWARGATPNIKSAISFSSSLASTNAPATSFCSSAVTLCLVQKALENDFPLAFAAAPLSDERRQKLIEEDKKAEIANAGVHDGTTTPQKSDDGEEQPAVAWGPARSARQSAPSLADFPDLQSTSASPQRSPMPKRAAGSSGAGGSADRANGERMDPALRAHYARALRLDVREWVAMALGRLMAKMYGKRTDKLQAGVASQDFLDVVATVGLAPLMAQTVTYTLASVLDRLLLAVYGSAHSVTQALKGGGDSTEGFVLTRCSLRGLEEAVETLIHQHQPAMGGSGPTAFVENFMAALNEPSRQRLRSYEVQRQAYLWGAFEASLPVYRGKMLELAFAARWVHFPLLNAAMVAKEIENGQNSIPAAPPPGMTSASVVSVTLSTLPSPPRPPLLAGGREGWIDLASHVREVQPVMGELSECMGAMTHAEDELETNLLSWGRQLLSFGLAVGLTLQGGAAIAPSALPPLRAYVDARAMREATGRENEEYQGRRGELQAALARLPSPRPLPTEDVVQEQMVLHKEGTVRVKKLREAREAVNRHAMDLWQTHPRLLATLLKLYKMYSHLLGRDKGAVEGRLKTLLPSMCPILLAKSGERCERIVTTLHSLQNHLLEGKKKALDVKQLLLVPTIDKKDRRAGQATKDPLLDERIEQSTILPASLSAPMSVVKDDLKALNDYTLALLSDRKAADLGEQLSSTTHQPPTSRDFTDLTPIAPDAAPPSLPPFPQEGAKAAAADGSPREGIMADGQDVGSASSARGGVAKEKDTAGEASDEIMDVLEEETEEEDAEGEEEDAQEGGAGGAAHMEQLAQDIDEDAINLQILRTEAKADADTDAISKPREQLDQQRKRAVHETGDGAGEGEAIDEWELEGELDDIESDLLLQEERQAAPAQSALSPSRTHARPAAEAPRPRVDRPSVYKWQATMAVKSVQRKLTALIRRRRPRQQQQQQQSGAVADDIPAASSSSMERRAAPVSGGGGGGGAGGRSQAPAARAAHELLQEAMGVDRLSQMYEGWTPWV